MADKSADVRQMMAGVSRAVAEPSILIDDFGRAERPQMYNLDFIYPPYVRSLRSNLDLVLRNWEIENRYEISSKRKYFGWLARVAKRAIRGLTSWYMNPLVNDVRKYNMVVTRTLFDINKNIEEIKDRLDDLEKSEEELRRLLSAKEGD
jgi:hypothetical protein